MARKRFSTDGKGASQIVEFPSSMQGACDNKMFFANRLKDLRSLAHLTQIEFADELGLSKSAVGNWESGRTRPDLANIPAICRALGITAEEFFRDNNTEAPQNEKAEAKLLSSYRRLSKAHQDVVLEMTDRLLMAESIMAREARRETKEVVNLVAIPLAEDAVAAGVNLDSFDACCKQVYLHDTPVIRRADMIFHVNGDSMEPKYPNQCYVLVKRDDDPRYGDVGIFQVDNSLFIKEYRKEGLYSLNPKWPLMRKENYGSIRFVGRVISVLDESAFATEDEISAYTKKP